MIRLLMAMVVLLSAFHLRLGEAPIRISMRVCRTPLRMGTSIKAADFNTNNRSIKEGHQRHFFWCYCYLLVRKVLLELMV